MKKKIVWLLVSCLIVAALVLASCAPAAEEEEEELVTPEEEEEVAPPEEEEVVTEEKEMVKVTLEKLDGTVVEKWVEKPKYGGVHIVALGSDIQGFDEVYSGWGSASCITLQLTNDELITGDFTKSAAGTGEASWVANEFFGHLSVGLVAESWEVPDDETVIFHIRKGIHWHDKPPVNGRELTADDVVFSWDRFLNNPNSFGYGLYTPEVREANEVYAPDKWTVVSKWLPGYARETLRHVGDYCSIMAPEVAEEYGDFKDWKNSIGTGPYMLVDFVPMSSATLVRNPNYWRKHPLYGDQLPYMDGVKFLVIPDVSTQISALRTGKIDFLILGWENARDVLETSPWLEYREHPPVFSSLIFMRTDKPELPFYDQRVRHALALGVNNQEIKDELYDGNAVLVVHPISPLPEFKDMYTPLEELPEAVQELYGYNPEKAKQLLAEAGYPDGFETSIICTAASADLLSLIKDYWEKIGVTLNLEVKESAVYSSIGFRRSHKEMYMGGGVDSTPSSWVNFAPGDVGNKSMVDDPRVNQAIDEWQEHSSDWDKLCQIAKETYPYILEQCWTIPLPTGYSYFFWTPWFKDYNGEYSVGYYNFYAGTIYSWMDEDLKKEMGY